LSCDGRHIWFLFDKYNTNFKQGHMYVTFPYICIFVWIWNPRWPHHRTNLTKKPKENILELLYLWIYWTIS
jgi:hypothetical protein